MSRMKGNSEDARSLNDYLDLMKSKILDIQMELIHRNELLTIEIFKNKLLGIQELNLGLFAFYFFLDFNFQRVSIKTSTS